MSGTNFNCHLCHSANFEESEIIITNCNHQFCLDCLSDYVKTNLRCKLKCPMDSCNKTISDFIIRELLDENMITEYENLCMKPCTSCHNCLLPQCKNFVSYSNKDIQYECTNCTLFNCIKCNAAHTGLSCNEYHLNIATKGNTVCLNELARARDSLNRKLAESNRQSIVEASKKAVLTNTAIFSCGICSEMIRKGSGVQLKNCFHNFCRNCLGEHINNSIEIPIPCPSDSCKFKLNDSEFREFMSDEKTKVYEDQIIKMAISSISGAYHCQSPDCRNWVVFYGSELASWTCNLCKSVNCLKCKSVHENKSCNGVLLVDESFIASQIQAKVLMKCLKCQNIIKKNEGCNWIICLSCRTELCWINQTYRWGPKGRDDTSGGCRCGVNGKYCHPDCRGCTPDNR